MLMGCHASNYVGRDNTMKKICERFFWPEYYEDTISRIMRLEYFYFTYLTSGYTSQFLSVFTNFQRSYFTSSYSTCALSIGVNTQ